ncbi:unnamed protein product [Cuscuta epithymum]|uniref:Uncharacterized protein n=1 Tax=Cuscuta epithymum TaxID=186058 RepID=A0AAV0ESN7_9ASTE|nr:unnamed protein product [Cuscuta epithymum]
MAVRGDVATSAGRGVLHGLRVGQIAFNNGGSISMVPVIRPPPEPPPWVVRGARVRESFSSNFYLFVICFRVSIYVVGFDSLFEFLFSLYVIGYGWIYGNRFGCAKPNTWLAICVALSG